MYFAIQRTLSKDEERVLNGEYLRASNKEGPFSVVFGHHHGWGRYKDSSNDSDDDFTDTFACARELTTVQRQA